MRIAVYVRVSTSHQVQMQTIEQQLERLQAHVQAQGWSLPSEAIFRDDGYSGATLNRPALDRLRDQVRLGQLDRVLLTAPDRLARNYIHQMLLIEELEHGGCQVEFLDRPMSQDPHDQLVLQIRGAVAEYERVLIAERMRRGRLAKMRAGVLLPWTKAPYGYRLDPERPRDPRGVTLEPTEAAVVAEMYTWYAEAAHSLLGLSRHLEDLGVLSPTGKPHWSMGTLRGLLINPLYTGQVYTGRNQHRPATSRHSATHPIGHPHTTAVAQPREQWLLVATIPAIVTQEQFDRVQAKLVQNQSFASRHNTAYQYLLRALVSCGHCRLSCMARRVGPGHLSYYVCAGKGQAVHSHREEKCRARYIPADQLDRLVWQDLCDVLTHPESIALALQRAQGGDWLPHELQARRENLRKARASVAQQLSRLTDAYLHAVIPLDEYQRHRRALEQQDETLATQEQLLQGQTAHQAELAGLVTSVEAFCQRVSAGLANATFEQRRELVELLVDRVIVTDEEVEIRYVVPTSPAGERIRFCHLRTDYLRIPGLRVGHAHRACEVGGAGCKVRGIPGDAHADCRLQRACLVVQGARRSPRRRYGRQRIVVETAVTAQARGMAGAASGHRGGRSHAPGPRYSHEHPRRGCPDH